MSDATQDQVSLLPDFNSPAALRHRRWRDIKDVATRYLMAVGGISVIFAIVLIGFYLLYVVIPMFKPADIEQVANYSLPGDASQATYYYAMEEQHEIGLRLDESGTVTFFKTGDGKFIAEHSLFAGRSAVATSFAAGDPSQRMLALGFSDGSVLLAQHNYQVSYPNDVRLISPRIDYPLGQGPLRLGETVGAITLLSAQWDGEQASIAALDDSGRIRLVSFTIEESLLGDEGELTRTELEINFPFTATHMIMDIEQRELYLADTEGHISYYDISNKQEAELIQRVRAVGDGRRITSLQFLGGGLSILVGDSSGRIAQWFPVRDEENNYTLQRIRYFDAQEHPVSAIAAEYFRKGFLAVDEAGHFGIYHTTAERTVNLEKVSEQSLVKLAVAPRANASLIETSGGELQYWKIDNEHPEISWRSIWGKVWYESRSKPEYIWQSSSASSDFEPKFSLTPLAFGTLKAAFYAMLFAVPMAICGAMFTAYFMTARMRAVVKPTNEIMEALPTVILGFLAGLWFAPFVEKHMPGLFLMLVLIPLMILATSYFWHSRPAKQLRARVPEGWEAALLIPVVIAAIYLSLILSTPVEIAFFGGNMPQWIGDVLGFDFDQRNSLVVGIAMGFAVIPTIFSISEDAIYSVPRHLTTGSLALGATRWQTMIRVVLLTASPGIFSAVMIGLGRAVGETMIVVMATGNTAIMDMNIFQGFRALSANIAVEMPESEVGGSHYRILFLAGLVLFIATFIFNTLAEIVRQRLRTKYSNL